MIWMKNVCNRIRNPCTRLINLLCTMSNLLYLGCCSQPDDTRPVFPFLLSGLPGPNERRYLPCPGLLRTGPPKRCASSQNHPLLHQERVQHGEIVGWRGMLTLECVLWKVFTYCQCHIFYYWNRASFLLSEAYLFYPA